MPRPSRSNRLLQTASAIAHRTRRALLDKRQDHPRPSDQFDPNRLSELADTDTSRPSISRAWRGAAAAFTSVGDAPRAIRALERATAANPSDPRCWLALAEVLAASGGHDGPVNRPVLGIVAGRQGDPVAAEFAYAQANRLQPSPAAALGIARQLDAQCRFDEALVAARAAAAAHPTDATAFVVLGRALARAGQVAGGLTSEQVEELTGIWSQAIRLGGSMAAQARYHFVRHASRFRQWDVAFDAADARADQPAPSIEHIERSAADPACSVSPEWWFVARWRMIDAGHYRVAKLCRDREAGERLQTELAPVPRLEAARQQVLALVAIGSLDEASDVLRRAATMPDPSGRLLRLRADLELRRGNTAPLVRLGNIDTGLPRRPQQRFDELIHARRVVVAGPNATPEMLDRFTNNCDVVADTKHLSSSALPSSVAHVSYYSDSSTTLFDTSISALLDGGELDLAVLRPSALDARFLVAKNPGVRIMPCEDSLSMGVSHFGIPRIVYDLVRHEPASITLVGVDMFTAPSPYPPDYLADQPAYERSAFAPVFPGFSHDLIDDHMMLSSLFTAGVIDADATTEHTLSQTLDDYLGSLEGVHAGLKRQA